MFFNKLVFNKNIYIKIVLSIVTILGLTVILFSLFLFYSTFVFTKNTQKTQGTITKSVYLTDDNNATEFPVIEFSYNGKNIQFTGNSSIHNPKKQIGRKVEILFNPNDPTKAKMNSFSDLYGGSFFLFLFGAAILGMLRIVTWILEDKINIFNYSKSTESMPHTTPNGNYIDPNSWVRIPETDDPELVEIGIKNYIFLRPKIRNERKILLSMIGGINIIFIYVTISLLTSEQYKSGLICLLFSVLLILLWLYLFKTLERSTTWDQLLAMPNAKLVDKSVRDKYLIELHNEGDYEEDEVDSTNEKKS